MALDETISAGQSGHIDHHEEIHTALNTEVEVLKSFTYIAQGTTTYTTPAGITAILVECIGAGGGGGGAASAASNAAGGGGGCGGGYSRKWITSPDASYTVQVGAGGAGGASTPANGTTGTDTTFGSPSVCTAKGGRGGGGAVAGTTAVFVTGGGMETGGVGDLFLGGQAGGPGQRVSGTMAVAGFGGMAARGGGGGRGRIDANPGEAPVESFGGGGSGGLVLNGSTAVAGAAGADGRIVVHEYGPTT